MTEEKLYYARIGPEVCPNCGHDRDNQTQCCIELALYKPEIDNLKSENAKLKADCENMLWNLAACSTFAMGYALEDKCDESMARAAFRDVRKMARENVKLKEAEREAFERGRQSVLVEQKCKDCECSYERCCCNPIRELEAYERGFNEAKERAARALPSPDFMDSTRERIRALKPEGEQLDAKGVKLPKELWDEEIKLVKEKWHE